MTKTLFTWSGWADFDGPNEDEQTGCGPIATAMDQAQPPYDEAVILCDSEGRPEDHRMSPGRADRYEAWLKTRHPGVDVRLVRSRVLGAPDFAAIRDATCAALAPVLSEVGDEDQVTFHLSPGTQVHGSVMFVLACLNVEQKIRVIHTATREVQVIDYSRELLARAMRVRGGLEATFAEYPEAVRQKVKEAIGESEAMEEVLQTVQRYAEHGLAILLTGETGVGKSYVASLSHDLSRRAGDFVEVNCADYEPALFRSELFGSVKGAYTGASDRHGLIRRAKGGTLFLDEVGELDSLTQSQLLLFLDKGRYRRVGGERDMRADVQIVAATNRDLWAMAAEGTFREDLIYRLDVGNVALPALRERGDVGSLARRLLPKLAESVRLNTADVGLSEDAVAVVEAYQWPGNIRELRHALQIALVESGGEVSADVISRAIQRRRGQRSRSPLILGRTIGGLSDFSLDATLDEVRLDYYLRARDQLRASGVTNKTAFGRALGVKSSTAKNTFEDARKLVDRLAPGEDWSL